MRLLFFFVGNEIERSGMREKFKILSWPAVNCALIKESHFPPGIDCTINCII